jgi:hypothetical protein
MTYMKYNRIIGITSILIISLTPFLSIPTESRDNPYNTTFIIAIIIGHYTTAERNSEKPWLLTLTGNFLVFGLGWSDPPGYAQPIFGFYIEKYPWLQGIHVGLWRNHRIIGLWHDIRDY